MSFCRRKDLDMDLDMDMGYPSGALKRESRHGMGWDGMGWVWYEFSIC